MRYRQNNPLGRPWKLLCILALGFGPLAAESPSDPPAEAEAVVRAQLVALQNNDDPEPDAGITTAWEYAHPANQASTGPLERFKRMVKGEAYRPLIDHRAHRVSVEEASESAAVFRVVVSPKKSGTRLLYLWAVAKVKSGPREGEWATTAVSTPRMLEEAI